MSDDKTPNSDTIPTEPTLDIIDENTDKYEEKPGEIVVLPDGALTNGKTLLKKNAKNYKPLTKRRKNKIREMIEAGYFEIDIYRELKVTKANYNYWFEVDEDFADEISDLKYKMDKPVMDALYRNATGFLYEEKSYKVIYTKDGNNNEIQEKVLNRVVEKHVLPETTAIMQWLSNRHPKEWNNRQQIDMNAKVQPVLPAVDFSNLSEDEAKNKFNEFLTSQENDDKKKR